MRSYWCEKYGNKVDNQIKFIEFFRMLSKDYNLFFSKKYIILQTQKWTKHEIPKKYPNGETQKAHTRAHTHHHNNTSPHHTTSHHTTPHHKERKNGWEKQLRDVDLWFKTRKSRNIGHQLKIALVSLATTARKSLKLFRDVFKILSDIYNSKCLMQSSFILFSYIFLNSKFQKV